MVASRCRPRKAFILPLLSIFCAAPAAGSSPTISTPWPSAMLEDADLHDVCFVDRDHGWAVGDRGVILRTENGGETWKRQASPIGCSLFGVHFVDEKTGWIVSGDVVPIVQRGSGTILTTNDGGRHWRVSGVPGLPLLTDVHFFDRQSGWAVGHPSALYPSGIVYTNDRGKTWSGLPASHSESWCRLAGDDTRKTVFALSTEGTIAMLASGQVQWQRKVSTKGERLHDLAVLSDGSLAVAGSKGFVQILRGSNASGLEIPRPARGQLDFACLAANNRKLWIAAPSAMSVLSYDGSSNEWLLGTTEDVTRLKRLAFVDSTHGWAVGSLGTVLRTLDGGQTWSRQRGQSSRVALLGLFAQTELIPWELLAGVASAQGYRVAVEVVQESSAEWPRTESVPTALKVHQAAIRAGANHGDATTLQLSASSTDLFDSTGNPLDQRADGTRVRLTMASHAADERATLRDYLAHQIRLWKPDVVIVHSSTQSGSNRLSRMIEETLPSAMDVAAREAGQVKLNDRTESAKWLVHRAFAVVDDDSDDRVVKVPNEQLAVSRSESVSQIAFSSRTRVQDSIPSAARWTFVRPLRSMTPSSGLGLRGAFDSDVRRPVMPPTSSLQQVRRQHQQMQNALAMFDHFSRSGMRGRNLLSQVDDLTRDLGVAAKSQVLFELAVKYQSSGRFRDASSVLEKLIDDGPKSELVDAALMSLARNQTSQEIRIRTRPSSATAPDFQLRGSGTSRTTRPRRKASLASFEREVQGTPSEYKRTVAETKLRALQGRIRKARPELMAEPSVRFLLASAKRNLGDPTSRTMYQSLAALSHGLYRRLAISELFLAGAVPTCPITVRLCPQVRTRPHLDGTLDDETWRMVPSWSLSESLTEVVRKSPWEGQMKRQAASPPLLQPVPNATSMDPRNATHRTDVWLAHNEDHLLVAVHCMRPFPVKEQVVKERRLRDTNLANRDRIQMRIDVDRDQQTAWELTVDDRGWANDACHLDETWNPQWYIASRSTSIDWTVEAAIPFNELQPSGEKRAWMVQFERIMPNASNRSLATPPDAFLLRFQESKRRQRTKPPDVKDENHEIP